MTSATHAGAGTDGIAHVHVHVTGIVQGVGYRPFVWGLATARGLAGWVRNASDGVHIEARGPRAAVDSFVLALSTQHPSAARVDTVHVETVAGDHLAPMASEPGARVDVAGAQDDSDFRIVASDSSTDRTTLVSPDIATCPDCERELFDPRDRRYHYPFINCTNCGPRFTIIDSLPYDRARTSMAGFRMCPTCAREYASPANRRFHAQPDACFACGPHLSWRTTEQPGVVRWGTDREASDAIVRQAAELLLAGGIVAVKGLGGFHLACDATNAQAVAELRARKHRPSKPFAVMYPRLDQVRRVCHVDATERDLLGGSVRPIVLLRRRTPEEEAGVDPRLVVADGVAGPLPELGVMLPYTPLQHLLMRAVGRPLVMTSGNLSDEPIIADDQVAVARLMTVADAFLGNDRPIRARYDDSVVRVTDGVVTVVRRARGIAPTPVALPDPPRPAGAPVVATPGVLACGPEQKATFAITRGAQAFVSQHVGDLENADAFDVWQADLAQFEGLFGLTWDVLACDLHPEYLSAKWARAAAERRGVPLVEVQHHHAHIAAVLGENDVAQKVVGVALDGTGYGTDGTIWGGEILLCDQADFRRVAHLQTFRLPGGAAAIRRPLRCAYGLLDACGLADGPLGARVLERLGVEGPVVRQMLARDLNCPRTSSAGRLFDAVAALLGLVDAAGYDGEPACLLEAAASLAEPIPADELPARWRAAAGAPDDGVTGESSPASAPDTPAVIDLAGLVGAVAQDVADGADVRLIARRFHEAFCDRVAAAALDACRQAGVRHVALSGGVLMNRIVLRGLRERLAGAGCAVLVPRELPFNDGCISYGQAVVARARLARGEVAAAPARPADGDASVATDAPGRRAHVCP
ncbi:carbamoyltransferase HypF [bacterium]|nr:carbamoyltransferase HypF [bacterium]